MPKPKVLKMPHDMFVNFLLTEAKDWLIAQLLDHPNTPILCPCCDRTISVWPAKIEAGNAAILVELYKRVRDNPGIEPWVAVEQYLIGKKSPLVASHSFGRLKYWGMIVKATDLKGKEKEHNGKWKITPFGELFAKREVPTWQSAAILNNRLLDFIKERNGNPLPLIDVKEAMQSKFDYDKMIAGESIDIELDPQDVKDTLNQQSNYDPLSD